MDLNYEESDHKPLSGWVCAAIGVGFLAFIGGAIIGVLTLSGG
jgi:hypothetical protein